MNDFSGTGVAVVTPFTDTHELDLPALRKIIRHLISAKVQYLVALGTTAETPVLSPSEKREILDVFFEVAGDKIPIVVGSGGSNTSAICKEIEEYSVQYPITGYLSVCPFYSKPTQSGLYEHFKEISLSTDLPIILYNIPGRTGINLIPETVLRLAEFSHNITAIKECSGDLSQCMDIITNKPDKFQLLGGDDVLSIPIMSIGARGVISVLANAFPDEYTRMTNFALQNDFKKAREIFFQLRPWMKICFEEGNPTGIKGILHELNYCTANTRLPNVPASDNLRSKIVKELTSAQTDASSNFLIN